MDRPIDPRAREALERAKAEIAEDMNLYNQTGFVGGSIGGTMTRRLVEMGEQILIDQYKNKK